ncbi:MAG: hypothetical protein WC091_22205, partial [Sulfuricellaceae bacterium]
AGLHGFPGAWRRCNSLQWNDHCASLRLALHPENRTLQPVQQRFLGLSGKQVSGKHFMEKALPDRGRFSGRENR